MILMIGSLLFLVVYTIYCFYRFKQEKEEELNSEEKSLSNKLEKNNLVIAIITSLTLGLIMILGIIREMLN
jgi:Ca2+/Na+ antiporter